MTQHPKALRDDALVSTVGDDTVVYKLQRHQAACLDATAAAVWDLCDGERDLDAIVGVCEAKGLTREQTLATLDRLAGAALVEGFEPAETADADRRDVLLKLTGAAAVGAVTLMTVPAAARSASCLPPGSPCTSRRQCCSDMCKPAGRKGRRRCW